jgi:hypothetical protein
VGGRPCVRLTWPFVNQEQAFWCGARAFVDPGFGEGFTRYWQEQSNPLGYSAIAALSANTLGLPLTPWSVRLPSVGGGVALVLAGWLLARELRPDEPRLFQAWAGVVTLNPLVWVYGRRPPTPCRRPRDLARRSRSWAAGSAAGTRSRPPCSPSRCS